MGRGPTQPIRFLNFHGPARPGPSIFYLVGCGPARLFLILVGRGQAHQFFQRLGRGPAQPITFLTFHGLARPGSSYFQNYWPSPARLLTNFKSARPGPDHRPMTSHDIYSPLAGGCWLIVAVGRAMSLAEGEEASTRRTRVTDPTGDANRTTLLSNRGEMKASLQLWHGCDARACCRCKYTICQVPL